LVALALTAGALAGLIGHVRRTNVALARFVEALRHGDFAVGFDPRGGAGFDRLGGALTDAMRDLRAERSRGAEELRFLDALLDDMPVALLTVDPANGVRLRNKAARRLFDRDLGTRPEDYRAYGEAFAERLVAQGAADEVLQLSLENRPQRAMVRASTAERLGIPVRIVTVAPIQGTLDAVELGTQSDLVRVLTHEILNSLTPVTSLAGTAAVLLGEENPDIAEARLAILTLARRSEGLRRFIESYRAVARAPEPRYRIFEATPFIAELERLFAVDWFEHRLIVAVDPGITLDADPDLLAQALLNLLRNAAQASVPPLGRGNVSLTIRRHNGGGVLIDIEDDGPGVPAALRQDVFLPFFTTRSEGTGVGLNLVRQIVVAHGWQITLDTSELGGARFRIAIAG
ncbi:ATP-binding protein, partial [Sphingomonas sp.]|uniref:sensor histidine kinase n=1 Tax=Sphingomonas sp. TaxID=28214 RepID=UPI0031E33CC3